MPAAIDDLAKPGRRRSPRGTPGRRHFGSDGRAFMGARHAARGSATAHFRMNATTLHVYRFGHAARHYQLDDFGRIYRAASLTISELPPPYRAFTGLQSHPEPTFLALCNVNAVALLLPPAFRRHARAR